MTADHRSASGELGDRPADGPRPGAMRIKLISCEVLYREIQFAVQRSPNSVNVQFLSKGLHELGARPMRERIQNAIDAVPESDFDAIVLGYGLCNNGLAGVTARGIPLVMTRAHDCITLFLGGRGRYLDYFQSHPGVYFKTTGWMERTQNPDDLRQLSIAHQQGMDLRYEELVLRYGEDNAQYLFDTLYDHTRNYSQITFIEMGVEPDGSFETRAREDARRRGWRFEKILGDLSLLQSLIDGPWDHERFLLVPAGRAVASVYDDRIVGIEGASSGVRSELA